MTKKARFLRAEKIYSRLEAAYPDAKCALDFAKGLMKYKPGDEGLQHLQAWRERMAERPALQG